jgi:hypothetical protein
MDNKEFTGSPMGQDMQQGQDQGAQGGQGGYCIEIYVSASGQPTSVNVETMEDDDAGMQSPDQGMGAAEDKGVPVASMDEAMSMVQQIVQNQGAMPDGQSGQGDQGDGNEQDEMMQGYGKGGIGARRSGLPVRKVFSSGGM